MCSDFLYTAGDWPDGVFFFFFFFHLTYSRWTSSLPSCLWSQRIFPSLPGSRLTIFYRDASSALLQLVNQWLNFTYSRSHAFRYESKGFTYLQSMDFQREPQSKHHLYLYCEQEKPAHCHGSLLLRLGTHQIQNRTRHAHKISPHGTMTKRTPAMNWDHAVSWGGGLG